MIIGYCRISSKSQELGNSLEAQRREILERYPDAVIYEETYTGATTDRPIFNKVIESLGENSTLVTVKLDRLARNVIEGIQIVQQIFEKNAAVHVLNVGLLEDSPMGHFFLTTLLAVAELERSMIRERTQTGKAIARTKNGFREGRPPLYSKVQINHALELLENNSYKMVSKMTGISVPTLVRAKRRQKGQVP